MVRVTAGEHPYFGRVVLDAPGLAYTVSRDGVHILIRFSDDPILGELPPTPHNVLAIRAVPGGVELTVPPGANVHTSRIGAKVVVDIDDTSPNRQRPTPPTDSHETPRPAAAEDAPGSAAISADRDTAAAPGHGLARSDSASSAELRLVPPAPTGAAANPDPGVIEHGASADAAATQRTPPGIAVTQPTSGQPRPRTDQQADEPSPAPSAERSTVRPGGPSTGQPEESPAGTSRELSEEGPLRSMGHPVGQPIDQQEDQPVVVPAGQPLEQPGGQPTGQPVGQPAGQPAGQPPGQPVLRSDGGPSEPEPTQPGSLQVWPVTRDIIPAGPVALRAIKARPPDGSDGTALRIPFTGAVGAALFSRGPDTYVVFDERRPIDLSALRDDPVFGSAVVTIYPAATVIHLTRPRGQSAVLFPVQLGWRLSVVPTPSAATTIALETANGVVTFAVDAPGQVVTIADPWTGGTLLVGTQRVSGQAILIERRTPEFLLPLTGQGIVVEPLSDAISLSITQAGFVLSGPPAGLALSPPQPMPEATLAAARLTRLFEFPRQTTANLAWREKRQAVAAAVAPLLTRGPRRHALAESMLGLGLGVEAQTLLRVTMKDDPREAASSTTIGLAAIAALLSGRLKEAGDLANPRLTGTDEIALWRAIGLAMADEGSPAAAAVFATTAPLLFTYPAEMRHLVLPLALETMILGGEAEAAGRLLAQREHDPRLAYARALLKQAQGDNEGALALFDAVTNTRSPLDHVRAAVRATELRLTMGQLDSKGAADALDARLYAWRGDGRDLALRLRIADLRGQSGAWRTVIALLRGAKADFPGQAAEIDRRLKAAFAAVPRDPALNKMEPTELIAMLEENAELMADGPDGEPMRVMLADKLMALDLPKRADPLLTKLMRAAPFGPARAGFGATLATLRLNEGDGDGAILALSESNSADMGDVVRERRALVTAQVEAKRGHTREALETLTGDRTPEAEEARAAILEQAQDWPAARDALAVLAARVVPDSGTLNEAQRQVVLRLATAAARADDDATLAGLREKFRTRIGTGPQADMFRLLTAEPVRGTADLARARAEMGLARAVTADMGPKKPAATTP